MTKKTWPILYKYTSKGQIQTWQIVAEDDFFYTVEGIQGGKLTQSLPTTCHPKNVGKKNATTAEEQAILEAQAKWQKKKDNSYNEVLTEKRNFFEPMLAFTYLSNGKEKKDANEVAVDWDDLKKKGIKAYVQPKLDGLRCVNEKNSLMSRNGKPYVACPHLHQNDTILDGELYTHTYKNDFNKIVSLCKKKKPTDEQLEECAEKVEFWAYDYPSCKGVFSARYKALERWILNQDNKMIRLVPTIEVKSEEDLIEWHAKFISGGYEGTILRIDNCEYENKRAKQLLKYKDFVDDEFTIVGYEEGEGGRVGTIGKFVVDLPNGKTCESNVKGSHEFLREVWRDRDMYVGTKATIKYFGYTPAGKLRFPYVIKLNREEYE